MKYYEELKIRVHWLKFDPHFWLQYGMARMNCGQLNKAQSNIDEAYVFARNRNNYDTSYIDTQQARLFLLKSFNESDGNIVWDFFQKAHNLLTIIKSDIYKYRQVSLYKRFYEKKYSLLSKKNKHNFKESVNRMKSDLEKSQNFYPDDIFSDYTTTSCYRYLTEILKHVS